MISYRRLGSTAPRVHSRRLRRGKGSANWMRARAASIQLMNEIFEMERKQNANAE